MDRPWGCIDLGFEASHDFHTCAMSGTQVEQLHAKLWAPRSKELAGESTEASCRPRRSSAGCRSRLRVKTTRAGKSVKDGSALPVSPFRTGQGLRRRAGSATSGRSTACASRFPRVKIPLGAMVRDGGRQPDPVISIGISPMGSHGRLSASSLFDVLLPEGRKVHSIRDKARVQAVQSQAAAVSTHSATRANGIDLPT